MPDPLDSDGSLPRRLALGTAQLGLDYGITNRSGRPTEREAAQILELALSGGIRTFDTAAAYGKSEEILGQLLSGVPGVGILTKTAPLPEGEITAPMAQQMVDGFRRSLERLRRDRVDALLLHEAGALRRGGAAYLLQALGELREEGLTRAIGASIYESADLPGDEMLAELDLVQGPLSALDQRLISDRSLARLTAKGVAFHARSVFLQGLILAGPEAMPSHIPASREPLDRFEQTRQRAGLSRVAAALAFVLGNSEVELAVVGANSRDELEEILGACAGLGSFEFGSPAPTDSPLLDPRRWNLG